MEAVYNRFAGQSLERLAALSDGVFAIAMTLLVLDLHVPPAEAIRTEHDLWRAVVALAPRVIAYLMSFITLGIFWVGQQTQLNCLARADRNFAWIHIAFLLAVSVTPFSTGLLAAFITYRVALLAYWFNVLLLGATLYGSWRYVLRAGLLREGTPQDAQTSVERRIVVAQALYALRALLCVVSTYWSIVFIVLLQLNYAIAPRLRLLYRL
ncbi:MAG TPA: TMEM175 family protein [bacterium]|nr:TMEM175 family protein [bacterium]